MFGLRKCHFLVQRDKKRKKDVLLGAAHGSTGVSEDYKKPISPLSKEGRTLEDWGRSIGIIALVCV